MTQVESSLDPDVVIVNYNAGKLLVDCVSSVFAAGAARAFVVDNNSTDGSLEQLRQQVVDQLHGFFVGGHENSFLWVEDCSEAMFSLHSSYTKSGTLC